MLISTTSATWEGVVTFPDASEYRLTLKSKGNIDIMTVKSCHRYETFEPNRIIKRKKVYLIFKPNDFEREQLTCPLFISAYEKGKGRHSFAMIDFKRPQYQAAAILDCNGSTTQEQGAAICQSGKGLYQRISFSAGSTFRSSCDSSIKKDGNAYKIVMPNDLCLITFLINKEIFRLTLYGFEKELIY